MPEITLEQFVLNLIKKQKNLYDKTTAIMLLWYVRHAYCDDHTEFNKKINDLEKILEIDYDYYENLKQKYKGDPHGQ